MRNIRHFSIASISFCALLVLALNSANAILWDADYIVVGSGPSGCVFAYEAAKKGYTVLMIERGGEGSTGDFDLTTREDTRVPWAGPIQASNTFDGLRRLYTKPQTGVLNLSSFVDQPQILGGGTTVNALIYVRGDLRDYDDYWPVDWDSNVMLQAYKSVENATNVVGADPNNRGFTGRFHLENNEFQGFEDILPDSVIASAANLGIPSVSDLNGDIELFGAGKIQFQRKNGIRWDSFTAFIGSIKNPFLKARIKVMKNTNVEKVLIHKKKVPWWKFDDESTENLKARGVIVDAPEDALCCEKRKLFARKGVVLAAGAVETPIILERSGVGDKNRLCNLGIETLVHNPQVGENLQDHIGQTVFFITVPSGYTNTTFLGEQAIEYITSQTGLFSSPSVNTLVFSKENGADRVNYASQLVQGLSFQVPIPGFPEPITIFVVQTYALDIESRGSIHYSGTEDDPYILDPNYGGNDSEIDALRFGFRTLIRTYLGSGLAFGALNLVTGEVMADPNFLPTREEMRNMLFQGNVIGGTFAGYHFTGSAALGEVVRSNTCNVGGYDPDDACTVVDIDNLHIVDASIMPKIPRANTMASVLAVARRASELILN